MQHIFANYQLGAVAPSNNATSSDAAPSAFAAEPTNFVGKDNTFFASGWSASPVATPAAASSAYADAHFHDIETITLDVFVMPHRAAPAGHGSGLSRPRIELAINRESKTIVAYRIVYVSLTNGRSAKSSALAAADPILASPSTFSERREPPADPFMHLACLHSAITGDEEAR